MSRIDGFYRWVGRMARRRYNPAYGGYDMREFDIWTEILRASAPTREAYMRFVAAQPIESNLLRFNTNALGLEEQEAIERRKRAGMNILKTKKPLTWWQVLLRAIPTTFNILLGTLAIISVATPPSTWSTFAILLVMIIISSLVQFWQEYRGKIAVVRLQTSITEKATVRRQESSKISSRTIKAEAIVPGDILLLNPGDNIPADCLIFESSQLSISQSSLTGESEPQFKSKQLAFDKSQQALFDFQNLVLMGSSVVSGTATTLVLATGDNSFIASITQELNKRVPSSAFQRGIRHVTYLMTGYMIVMVTIVLCIQGLLTKNWSQAALFSVAVAVGIVPEMLPAIVNTNLARGAFKLAKQRAIVKRLDAVQNLGGMTILCSDKTGTLTQDEISLCHYEDCRGTESTEVLHLAYTNALYQKGNKNSIDAAIITKAENSNSLIPHPVSSCVAEIPFNFEKRRSSVIINHGYKSFLLICKGAFEEVLALCGRVRIGGSVIPFSNADRQRISSRAHAKNDDGYRVLALAVRNISSIDMDEEECLSELESDMTLYGLLTFIDPPKEDAATAIAHLQCAGVGIKVLTGDNLRIALKICRSLNIFGPDSAGALEAGVNTITGNELARLNQAEFRETVLKCTVFAKLTPAQKGDVVKALKQHRGQVVGMLGDGINDCVALRAADVGISVDSAVPVAKECADVILATKSLSIIVDSVRIGRITHGNSIKYIKMVASSNFGNVFSVMVASAWLQYQPMTALQILVQNLLYDISQIALPWDGIDEEYLRVPQQWNTWDLLRFIVVLGPTSSTIDMCTFCLDWFYYGIQKADSPLVRRAHTHWFLEGLLTQTLIVHLLRTAKIPFIQSMASWPLLISTSVIMTIGIVIPYIGCVAKILAMVRPASSFMGFLVAELLLYCLEIQLVKVVYKWLFKTWL